MLFLFGAFSLYGIKKLIENAKTRPKWDPINESFGIYLEAIILYELIILKIMVPVK